MQKMGLFCIKIEFFPQLPYPFISIENTMNEFSTKFCVYVFIIELRSIMTNVNDFEYQLCQASKIANTKNFKNQ